MSKFAEAFYHVHAHSTYSVNDAMAGVDDLVAQAQAYGQRALALTDHGVAGGAFDLYQACRKVDMTPLPGVEAYFTPDYQKYVDAKGKGPNAKRYHMGIMALDYEGYLALVQLLTHAHRDQFYAKPMISAVDLAWLKDSGATEHLAVTTGCVFGYVPQLMMMQGYDVAKMVLHSWMSWFPHLFVEVQHHHTPRQAMGIWPDDEVARHLFHMAQELGLPVIATNDVHYLEQEQVEAHTMMKALAFGDAVGDDAFPGDSYHLCDGLWVQEHFLTMPEGQAILDEAALSYDHLLKLSDLSLPFLDNYSFLIPQVVEEPVSELEAKAMEGYKARKAQGKIPAGQEKAYQQRAKEELALITDTGFDQYFLLVADVCQYARQEGIRIQARGSANGSLLCWLLGITDVDSIEWGLTMDAFMTRDRSKPPDIDLDTETLERARLIDYVSRRFKCIQQGTASRWGYDEVTDTGSLFLQYKNLMRKTKPNSEFLGKYGPCKTMDDLQAVDPGAVVRLEELNGIRPWKSYGAHAAGYVLDNPLVPVEDVVPYMRIGGGQTGRLVTQMLMDQLENAGFVKLDMLGQRTLTSLHFTLDKLGWSWEDYERNIPFDDELTFIEIGKGEPANAVFQLEGFATAIGAREMRPRNVHEVIQCISLYRPGAREWAPDFLRNRANPAQLRYPHPVCEPVLKDTHGIFLFTEQVITIGRAIGLSPEHVQKMLKAMKVKHSKRGFNIASKQAFDALQGEFVDAARTQGVGAKAAQEIWERIENFNLYAFKSLTGDTLVRKASHTNRGGSSSEVRLDELYHLWSGQFHRLPPGKYGDPRQLRAKYLDPRRGIKLMALDDDGRVRPYRVLDVQDHGIAETWKFILANGATITSTAEHRHLTPAGFVYAKDLHEGDELFWTDYQYDDALLPFNPAKIGTATRERVGVGSRWAAVAKERALASDGRYRPTRGGHYSDLRRAQRELPRYCEDCGSIKDLHTAHLNGDRRDSSRANTRRLCRSCHWRWDYLTGDRKKRNSKGYRTYALPIVAIEYMGEQHVYDVTMDSPNRSFMANGIATHNCAHATPYGILAYRQSWLKKHYPTEFFYGALLGVNLNGEHEKEARYEAAARRAGVHIGRTMVNASRANWAIDPERPNTLRPGYASIRGIGSKVATALEDAQPFASLDDMRQVVSLSGWKRWDSDGEFNGDMVILQNAEALTPLGLKPGMRRQWRTVTVAVPVLRKPAVLRGLQVPGLIDTLDAIRAGKEVADPQASPLALSTTSEL